MQTKEILSLATGFLLFITSAMGQQKAVERDTSFTVYGSFLKTKKNFPDISYVSAELPKNTRLKANIRYCEINGRDLELDVFHPKRKSKKGYPAVLVIHGGGWRSGDRTNHAALAAQLAAHGYVAVTAEYRLSTEALYPAAVTDLKTAIRWIRANAKKFNVDTAKIASLGFSAGGQLAALIGTTNGKSHFEGMNGCYENHSSSVQAIVDIDGTLAFIHPESGEGNDTKGPSAATLWFGASKKENPALWHEAAPLNHVTSNTPPVLFINSSVDRMHAGRDDMIKKLNAYNIYSEVQVFKDAPHVFPLFNPWFAPTVNYTVTFLDKVFKK
ncbi:alpha/beta hydrolase [Pedobacter sp. SYSU D00535]|uniref:alpha/beta hydrolase n=1 Tax=Pedobacter sp. SYSU D00535 TaxID=2810308 RepID=UPI001A957664|nr:alpha/beta hydrolase [Pedobacter sp. SYSU D00535]